MKKRIKAILCDLDGVLTDTARLHAKAWKKLFDNFLKERSDQNGEPVTEFSIEHDYPKYVDGKPRLDGIRSFLSSRNISIPDGSQSDGANVVSVYSLGEQKNLFFHELIETESVDVIEPSVNAVREWKKAGMKTAVVSSSKNCKRILTAAGIEELFDVIVDGQIAEEHHLKGKPEPDTFLFAAKQLDITPECCALAEDAQSGIQASVDGGFGLTVAVFTEHTKELLQDEHPDILVRDLSQLHYTGASLRYPKGYDEIPHESSEEDYLKQQFDRKKIALFFDYDGTLTPIVAHPEDAILEDGVRSILKELADVAMVTIISGRDKEDVKRLVGLDNVYYAGSHGFDIEGPKDSDFRKEKGEQFKSAVVDISEKLNKELKQIPGVQIEQKKYAVAVHYRNVPLGLKKEVQQITNKMVKQSEQLKTGNGKMVIEVRPNIDWDKGKAMQWIINSVNADNEEFHHLYIGDDITDEDAFKALPENGTGILVGSHGQPSYADFRIESPNEVADLLKSLHTIIKNNERMGVNIQ